MVLAMLVAALPNPSVTVVLNRSCPCNEICAPELNILYGQLSRENIFFAGVVNLPQDGLERYKASLDLSFPLYADPQLKKIGRLGAKYSLELVVSDAKGNRVRRLTGYNRTMIIDLAKLLSKLAGRPVRLAPGEFPETLRIGCAFEPKD